MQHLIRGYTFCYSSRSLLHIVGSKMDCSNFRKRMIRLSCPNIYDKFSEQISDIFLIWATPWQNQQNGMCARQRLSLIRVFAVCMKTVWVLSYPLSVQRRLLISLSRCPGIWGNKVWHFMKIVSVGDKLLEMSEPVFWKKIIKNISVCCLLIFLPSTLSVNPCPAESIKLPHQLLIFSQSDCLI